MGEDKTCRVCGVPIHSLADFCPRCKRIRDREDIRHKPNRAARAVALREAWDGEGFRCHYTDVRLVENDHHDPLYLTFDHRTPRDEDDVVVCAALINDMKSDLSEAEFRAVILQLASCFTGGDFDAGALHLRHYRR